MYICKIIVASDSFQEAFNEIPGLEAVMPKEYGGNAPSFEKIWGEKVKLNISFLRHTYVYFSLFQRLGRASLNRF